MGKAVLLTGKPGIGKTTALKSLVNTIGLNQCGGFYTEEMRQKGQRIGFQIVTLGGKTSVFAHSDWDTPYRVGRYHVNCRILDSLGVQSLIQAISTKKFVIIDEIGPMELFSENFKQAVLEVLDSNKTLLGTIIQRPFPWANDIKNRPGVQVFPLTLDNRVEMISRVIQFLNLDHNGTKTEEIPERDRQPQSIRALLF